MIRFNPTTPVMIYVKAGGYLPGVGHNSGYMPIEGVPIIFCEWRGGFGAQAISAHAAGVNDYATIRTFYHPTICEALRTKQAAIIKNADPAAISGGELDSKNPNIYELWGGVDNIAEENRFLEFKVRRYEGK